MIRTLTAEHDTVEDVSRDADAEDEGIQIAAAEVLYGCVSLQGNDVIGVVPGNKAVYVTIAFAVTKVRWNLHHRRHGLRNLAEVSLNSCYFMFYPVPRISNEQNRFVLSNDPADSYYKKYQNQSVCYRRSFPADGAPRSGGRGAIVNNFWPSDNLLYAQIRSGLIYTDEYKFEWRFLVCNVTTVVIQNESNHGESESCSLSLHWGSSASLTQCFSKHECFV